MPPRTGPMRSAWWASTLAGCDFPPTLGYRHAESSTHSVPLLSRHVTIQTGTPRFGALGPARPARGSDPMGRGRAKAKQTKVARELKYRTHETDFGALARELHGNEDQMDEPSRSEEPDEWSGHAERDAR